MLSFGMAVDVRDGIDMGALVGASINELGMQHKEAWLACGYPNASQWSKALIGEAPLDLWKMRHLPARFWRVFLMKLASAVICQFWDDVSGDMQMVKADVESSHSEERKRA